MNINLESDKDICRICLQKKGPLFSLFRKRGDGFSPYEKIISYTKVLVSPRDGAPRSICSQCLSELDVTVSFLDKCEHANNILAARPPDTAQTTAFNLEFASNPTEDIHKVAKDEIDESNWIEAKTGDNMQNDKFAGDSARLAGAVEDAAQVQCAQCGSRRRCRHWAPPSHFQCQQCHKTFNRKANYIIHLKRHAGAREHPCSTCGARFITRSLAQRHCAPRPRHACPHVGCGKSFTTTTNLRTHVRMHNGERPHQCNECGKDFACKNTLRDHMRIHTGEKPYICSVCGKTFTTNKLSAHMRTHTHSCARPHACRHPACPRRFPDPRALARHMATHARRERVHACAVCGARYTHSQSRNKHMRKHHGLKAQPPTNRTAETPAGMDEG